jgi:hypothetical protein
VSLSEKLAVVWGTGVLGVLLTATLAWPYRHRIPRWEALMIVSIFFVVCLLFSILYAFL